MDEDEKNKALLFSLAIVFALGLAIFGYFCGDEIVKNLNLFGKIFFAFPCVLVAFYIFVILEIIPLKDMLINPTEEYKTPVLSQNNLWDFETIDWRNGILVDETILFIPNRHFEGRYQLQRIKFYNDDAVIGESVFLGCKNLKEVVFPKKLLQVQNFSFEGCCNLDKIEFPSTLKGIGKSAFKDCKKLSSIKIPKSVEVIGDDAFADCKKLEKIFFETSENEQFDIIPDTLKQILTSGTYIKMVVLSQSKSEFREKLQAKLSSEFSDRNITVQINSKP